MLHVAESDQDLLYTHILAGLYTLPRVLQAEAYRERIMAAVPAGSRFQPLMTLYLTDRTPPEEVLIQVACFWRYTCKQRIRDRW